MLVGILQLAFLCFCMLSFKKTNKHTVNFIFDLLGFTGITFSTRENTMTTRHYKEFFSQNRFQFTFTEEIFRNYQMPAYVLCNLLNIYFYISYIFSRNL